MMRWQLRVLCCCGVFGCTGVILAALATHLPDSAFILNGRPMLLHAVNMVMWHALALLGFSLSGQSPLRWIAYPMVTGTLFFVIPVCSLALRGPTITLLAPIGGTIIIASWASLAVMAYGLSRHTPDTRKRTTP